MRLAQILQRLFPKTLETYMHPKVAALETRVATLESQWASGRTEWNGLKASFDQAVERIGQLENAPVPTSGLQADDEAALDSFAARIEAVAQGVADARVVNNPAN